MAREIKERTDLPLADRNVSMSNALARTAQGLSLSEKRILALGLAKTDSVSGGDAVLAQRHGGWIVRLLADEYAESYDVTLDAAYQQLKSGAEHLFKREARLVEKARRGQIVTRMHWCSKMVYHTGEGWVELHFHHEVAPHLLALRKNFCTYKLKQAAALRSIYAWRLFECLQSWKDKGVWHVSIEDFMHAMDVPASMKKDFGQLDRRVIKPAVEELRLHGDLEIEVEREKAGRKVRALLFRFKPNPQRSLAL